METNLNIDPAKELRSKWWTTPKIIPPDPVFKVREKFSDTDMVESNLKGYWGKGLVSLLFPEKCPFCRSLLTVQAEDMPGLCPACSRDIQWIDTPLCPRCGLPFTKGTDTHLCADCLREKHRFDWARAMVGYQGVMAEAIQRFKYRGEIQLAESLGWFWKKEFLEDLSIEAIIPVPLHPARLRKRGFNQSLLLGRILGRILKKEVLIKGLRRIRNTVPQVELDHSQREKNVRGAFVVREPLDIRGKDLLLVDDVFTTGATVNECTKVLKKAGARQVQVLTLARA